MKTELSVTENTCYLPDGLVIMGGNSGLKSKLMTLYLQLEIYDDSFVLAHALGFVLCMGWWPFWRGFRLDHQPSKETNIQHYTSALIPHLLASLVITTRVPSQKWGDFLPQANGRTQNATNTKTNCCGFFVKCFEHLYSTSALLYI